MFIGSVTVLLLVLSVVVAALLVGIAIGRRGHSRQAPMLDALGDSELRASEERLRLAMRATNDAIWDWRADSDAIEWGEGIRSLYGGEPEPSLEWWQERIHPNDREEVLETVRAALADPGVTVMTSEYRFGRSDGGWSTVVARGCIVRDDGGRAVRVIGALADITEQRKMQQQLQQSARLSSLGRLAGGMAHEFNNVLMAIQPFADLLRRRRDDSTVDRAIEQITNAVQRGRRVTEEIMRFTRPAKPALKKMHLASWLAAIRNELQALIAPVALVIDAPPDGLGIEGDASQLRQAMVNLVVNARDAMERRGMVVVIASEAGREEAARHGVTGTADSWVHLAVRDEGPGISENDLPHLFEPLFTTKPSGTGLGLAITHTAIRQHGGTIDAESRPGEGATFHIFLPRIEIETVEEPLSGPRRLPRRVLVIEDDHDVAIGLAELLGAEGCEVVVAPTGTEGLLQVQKLAPDVVLLDVDLPDANGRELYERIRGIAPSIPIVLTSGHVLGSDASNENIVFLQKPYELEALLEAVDAAGA
jgi:PAS domain S-box-containing protein